MSGVFAPAASDHARNSPPQQQEQQHLDVLFVGKRADVVPVMLALATGKPYKTIPSDWSDSHLIDTEILAPGTSEPVPATFFYGDASSVHDKRPQVVVLCYAPVDGLAHAKPLLDEWSLEVRSVQPPRPTMVLCAVRTEKIHTHSDINVTPVSATEACDLFVRTRAATYMEVSAELGVHLKNLAESIAHAALFEAEKRPLPEIVHSLRDHVLVAAFAGAKWVAKRHPRTKRICYMNRATKKPQYERPPDFDGIEPELTEEEKRQLAAAELEARERRARLERERLLDDVYLADVQLFEERMRSLEAAYNESSRQQAEYEKEVSTLRRQMAENSDLLRRLQHKHDLTCVKHKSSFVSSEAERDAVVEKELQEHRERLFRLESSLALREEKEDDVHLMELSVENRKLATDVRASLKRQLETQRGLAAMQARLSELARESEQTGAKMMRLRQKQQQSRGLLKDGSDDIAVLRQKLGELETEINLVVNAEIAEASSQSLRQKQLFRAIAHAEKALQDARGSGGRPSTLARQVVDEHARLRSEQQRLVTDVAGAAAVASQWELRVRRALTTFQTLSSDLAEVLGPEGLHGVSIDFAALVQTAVQEVQFCSSGGRGATTASAMAALGGAAAAAAVNSPQTPRGGRGGLLKSRVSFSGGRGAASSSSPNLRAVAAASLNATPLEEKIIALHRAALSVVRETQRDMLRRTQRANDVAGVVAQVFDDVLSVPEANAPPIPETLSPAQRLLAKCAAAIRSSTSAADSERIKEELVSGFETQLRAAVARTSNKHSSQHRKRFI